MNVLNVVLSGIVSVIISYFTIRNFSGEKYDFHDMVVSIKSSDVLMCAEAYRLVADKINYPLYVGITEAGKVFSGNI